MLTKKSLIYDKLNNMRDRFAIGDVSYFWKYPFYLIVLRVLIPAEVFRFSTSIATRYVSVFPRCAMIY